MSENQWSFNFHCFRGVCWKKAHVSFKKTFQDATSETLKLTVRAQNSSWHGQFIAAEYTVLWSRLKIDPRSIKITVNTLFAHFLLFLFPCHSQCLLLSVVLTGVSPWAIFLPVSQALIKHSAVLPVIPFINSNNVDMMLKGCDVTLDISIILDISNKSSCSGFLASGCAKVIPIHLNGKSTALIHLCIHVYLKGKEVWQPGEDCHWLGHAGSG